MHRLNALTSRMRARCLRISCVSRHDRSVRSARLVGQASLGSRPYRWLSARVSRAVDHRELPCRPGRRAVPRLPRCHDRPRQTPRPPAPDGPGGGPFREHVAEWAGARPGSLLLSLGEYHRTGDISPVRGFKSPLGHFFEFSKCAARIFELGRTSPDRPRPPAHRRTHPDQNRHLDGMPSPADVSCRPGAEAAVVTHPSYCARPGETSAASAHRIKWRADLKGSVGWC